MREYERDYFNSRLDLIENVLTNICVNLSSQLRSMSGLSESLHVLNVNVAELKSELSLGDLDGTVTANGLTFNPDNILGKDDNILKGVFSNEIINSGCRNSGLTLEDIKSSGLVTIAGKCVDITLPSGVLTITVSRSKTQYDSVVNIVDPDDTTKPVQVNGIIAFSDSELTETLRELHKSCGVDYPVDVIEEEVVQAVRNSNLVNYCSENVDTLYQKVSESGTGYNSGVGGISVYSPISHVNGIIIHYVQLGNRYSYNIGTGKFYVGNNNYCEEVRWDSHKLAEKGLVLKGMLAYFDDLFDSISTT